MTTINLATMSVSVHAREHRWNRIVQCVQAVGGVGEVIYSCPSNRAKYGGQVVNCVTSTGLVFVVDLDKNTLITGYLGSVRHIQGLYKNRLPDELFIRVRRNERKYGHLFSLLQKIGVDKLDPLCYNKGTKEKEIKTMKQTIYIITIIAIWALPLILRALYLG